MGPAETDRSERGAWTPFVGVALAALTAGSLLLFSFIAQRTSLEGFSTRGVTAVSPSLAAPRSITLPEPSDESEAVAGPGSAATTTETALSTLSATLDAADDLAPATTTPNVDVAEVADEGGAATPAPPAAGEVADGDDDDQRGRDDRDRDDDGTFTASFADDAESEIFFRDGEGRAAAQEWEAPDEDDADRSPKARAKGRKGHKAKSHKGKERGKASGRKGGGHNCSARAQRAKHNRDASARKGSGRGCSPRPNQRRGGSDDRGARGRSHHSAKRGGPADHGRPTHSSPPAPRPQPRPQPQRASHGNANGSPPAHSNAGGRGGHGRGRGHGGN